MDAIITPEKKDFVSKIVELFQNSSYPWWLQCTGLWFLVDLILNLISFIVVSFGDYGQGYLPSANIPINSIPGLWTRWDSYSYLTIANEGYAGNPLTYGYFPLFPVLLALLSRVTGFSLAAAGVIIAQLSYLFAILGLYKLARLIQDDHSFAIRCVVFMLLFPTSFFYFAVYAESLYLAFAILGTYLALSTQPRFIFSGISIGIAAFTRPVGWLLDIILIREFFQKRDFRLGSFIKIFISLVFSIIGIFLFIYYLYTLTGTILAIPQSQAYWQRNWQFPWITYGKSLWIAITGNRVPGDWFLYVINWVDLSFTTVALLLTILAFRWSLRQRFPWSLSLYLGVSLLFLLSSQGPYLIGSDHLDVVPLWGLCRWVAALFPLYLVMGQQIDKKYPPKWTLYLISSLLLAIFTAWWVSGRWVG